MTERTAQPTNPALPVAADIDQIETTPQQLSALVEGQPEFVLHHKAAPDAWSITEILGHLLDHERLVPATRFTNVLTTANPTFESYDQNALVQAGGYATANASDLVSAFDQLRSQTAAMLRALTPDQWTRTGTRADQSTVTLAQLVSQLAAHDRDHLAQLDTALRHAPGANR